MKEKNYYTKRVMGISHETPELMQHQEQRCTTIVLRSPHF
jgi:hypothetical protein